MKQISHGQQKSKKHYDSAKELKQGHTNPINERTRKSTRIAARVDISERRNLRSSCCGKIQVIDATNIEIIHVQTHEISMASLSIRRQMCVPEWYEIQVLAS